VYQIENVRALLGSRRSRPGRPRLPRVGRTVVLLGLTSMFTDISSEMVAAILPLYLVFGLGLSPLQFGVVDGVYQGVAALVRVASGVVGDRWRRHKEVAAVGYGLSAVSRIAMPLVGSAWNALTAVVIVDRTGKGIRTAPRDAMISLSSSRDGLATAFGVHRALDTAGAMLGPLVAFAVLSLAPRSYDAVFVVSFCFAIVGLGILVLFVEGRTADDDRPLTGERPTPRAAVRLLGGRRFRVLVAVGSALALATVSDAFIYLALQRRLEFDVTLLPLLYIGTALVYMLLAVPAGRLADRVGRARIYLAGYGMLLLVYGTLLLPSAGGLQVAACLLLFGAYYAATEGVLMALASTLLAPSLRATGLAVLVTATSLGRLASAIAFGALWALSGADVALAAFGAGLVVAMALAAAAFIRLRRDGDGGLAAA
jgi:MFS family permease